MSRLYIIICEPGKIPRKKRAIGDTVEAWKDLALRLRVLHPDATLVAVEVYSDHSIEVGSVDELLSLDVTRSAEECELNGMQGLALLAGADSVSTK